MFSPFPARGAPPRRTRPEYPHGARISDCGAVAVRPDVPPDLLREKVLCVADCMTVRCTPEQKAVLFARCSDVMRFKTAEDPLDPNVVSVRAPLFKRAD